MLPRGGRLTSPQHQIDKMSAGKMDFLAARGQECTTKMENTTNLTKTDNHSDQNLDGRVVAPCLPPGKQPPPVSETGNPDWSNTMRLWHACRPELADTDDKWHSLVSWAHWIEGLYPITHYGLACHALEEHHRYEQMVARRFAKKEAKSILKAKLGPREFTLTYSPAWYDDDKDAQRAMLVAVERLTKYYRDEIIDFHVVGEYTKDGRAHIHGWYHLTGGNKITDKNFKRAWKHWNPKKKLGKGFEGGHHETIQRVSDFHGYTEKHLEEAWYVKDITNAPQTHDTEAHDNPTPQDDNGSPS